MRGDGRIYLRGNVFWIAYYLRGEKFRESAQTTDEKEAVKFLRKRMREVGCDIEGARPFTTPKAGKATVHELLEGLKADYKLRDKDSGQNFSHLKRADDDFGKHLAVKLTTQQIRDYMNKRRTDGDAKASINRPLQLLRQAYSLAVKSGDLARAPHIPHLSEEGNARKGFVDEAQFRAILEFLPSYLKDFCLFAYVTGMRYGEVRSLKWANVKGDEIELEALDAKTGEARIVPMVGKDLAGILARRREAKKVKRGGTTTIADLFFHHNAKAIVDIKKAWRTACRKAGMPHLLFHDLRRSAVKHMDEAGVSRDVAMSISGHKSQSMYTRYNIVNTQRARQALEHTQAYREGTTGNVVSISK
ncbi:MAG TPA: site-specific integrase [Candidatus Dormibacteraeota bacterium]|nr:site-specific integrase [Candidatus Dormibacteraeota bacterium]